MLSWKTGEITLPEITLYRNVKLNNVLMAISSQVKADSCYKEDEQGFLHIWLYFIEPPVVADGFVLESIRFDENNALQQFQLSPVDIGDEEYGSKYRAPIEKRLNQVSNENGGMVTDEHKQWQFDWGSVVYDHDHFVDIYLQPKHAANTTEQKLINEFNSLGFLPHVDELLYGPGFLVNLSLRLPNGTTAQFWDDEQSYYVAQLPSKQGRYFGLVGDEHNLLVCEYNPDGSNAELIVYKKWRT